MVPNTITCSSLLLNLLASAFGQFIGEISQNTIFHAAEQNVETSQSKEHLESTSLNTVMGRGSQSTTESIGKWKQYEVAHENPTWNGNPFDLELTATFTHIPTGRTFMQLGYYAGSNIWKILFMPDELGDWTFTTSSPDPDLNGRTGSFTCVSSELPGQLIAEGNRFKLKDSGKYVAPILLATNEWFKSNPTENGIDKFILWTRDTAGSMIIGTTLVFFTSPQDAVPYIKGQEGITFNIEFWDRLNSHYDMLRDQGMGFYIMFYSDDEDSPNRNNIKAHSLEEMRLFRYALARFSAYPIVMWDTGIDISEYRDGSWIDWFADWFNENDPWQHLVSSRTGGGSGGKIPNNATYYSDGAATLPDPTTMVHDWKSRNIPMAYTDRWRENFHRGNFNRDMIRRAAWEVGLVGGTAVFISGNENRGSLGQTYETDLGAAPDLGHRSDFLHEHILDLGKLTPHAELLTSGQNAILSANLKNEFVVYDFDGGTFSIDLEGIDGEFNADWFNPRTGEETSAGIVSGGGVASFTAPGNQDWVLHLINTSEKLSSCSRKDLIAWGQGVNKSLESEIVSQDNYHIYLPMSLLCGD